MHGTIETDIAGDPIGKVASVTRSALEDGLAGRPIDDAQALHLISLGGERLASLFAVADRVRTGHKGRTITYSPKVFLPITNLCRNYCSYCTFRADPDSPAAWTMTLEEVRDVCDHGSVLGCIEALMCLGDKPERVFPSYQRFLERFDCHTTVDYLEVCCGIALEAGLLPHTNAGLLTREDMRRLKRTNVSLGLMLENVSPRLRERGGPHHNAPDKDPALRLTMMREAGELQIPFTTGILVGIGETLEERIASLRAIGNLHSEFGHIQEIIVQNFRAKPDTRMAGEREPDGLDTARTIAVARLMFPDMNIQAPPNLSPYDLRLFLTAGINDWGGISPLTRDFVNPEAPWPQLSVLAATCRSAGFTLAPRLPVYPQYLGRRGYVDGDLAARALCVAEQRGVHHVARVA